MDYLPELLRIVAQGTATLVEAIGVLIVAVAVARTVVDYVRSLVGRADPFPPEALRLELGRSLALSLEFLLGADILRTAVEPSWDEIARLAAIAAIRTALNFFLSREIRQERAELRESATASGDGEAAAEPHRHDPTRGHGRLV